MTKFLLNSLFLVLPGMLISQVTINDVYSSYGLGVQANTVDPVHMSLGGMSMAYSDSNLVNYYNSSSHSGIVKGFPLFSIAVRGQYSRVLTSDVTENNQFATLDHMYFAIPFSKRFGFAFGITPYASRGYSFSSNVSVGEDSVRFEYDGNGNITKGFGAFSAMIIDKPNFQFSVGTNLGFLFGQTINTRFSKVFSEEDNIAALQTDRLRSFHYDVSASVFYKLNDRNQLKLSGYYEPQQSLNSIQTNDVYYDDLTGSNTSRLLLSSETNEGAIKSAAALKFGVNYAFTFHRITRKNKEFDSQLNIVGEYQNTQFSGYKEEFNTVSEQQFTGDFSKLSLGIQYTPSLGYYKNFDVTNVWNRMKYRAGAYTSTLPFQSGGENYQEFGTTFGIGIPLAQYTHSSLNFGVDLGKRTNASSDAIQKDFVRFNIGVIISPSNADKWFRKVKLD